MRRLVLIVTALLGPRSRWLHRWTTSSIARRSGRTERFGADDFDWALVPQLVERAFVAIGIERNAEIRVDVERPNQCGPLHVQVSLEKDHRTLGAFFDRAGRLNRVE